MRRVFVEVHDFGFGPACGFLDITEPFADEFHWHVLAVGNAAAYIRRERPKINIIPFDGFNRESWPKLRAIAPPEVPIVSLSNPGFAAYAAQHGHNVCLVDQLDWMWDASPAGIDDVYLHLVQYYFGQSTAKARAEKAIEIRPIVTPLVPELQRGKDAFRTVIGLGGMAIAGNPHGGDAYAKWILPHILSALDGTPEAFPICVVGGSPNLPAIVDALGDSRVSYRVGVTRGAYMRMLQDASFQILTPGLASIYEAAVVGFSPLFQPGVNKSMVLQLQSLSATGYPFIMAWPWFEVAASDLKSLPAARALELITNRISSSIRGEDNSGDILKGAIRNYILRRGHRPPPIHVPAALPDGSALLHRALEQLCAARPPFHRPSHPTASGDGMR